MVTVVLYSCCMSQVQLHTHASAHTQTHTSCILSPPTLRSRQHANVFTFRIILWTAADWSAFWLADEQSKRVFTWIDLRLYGGGRQDEEDAAKVQFDRHDARRLKELRS